VDESQRTALLFHTELARVVGCIRVLVYTCSELLLKKLDDIFKDAWENGEILLCPRNVFNNRDLNGREVLITKPALLCFHLC